MPEKARRGSSLFSSSNAGTGESSNNQGVNPPAEQPRPGGAARRSSSILQPGALGGIGFGIDFDDSDYDDSDDEDGPPAGGTGGGANNGQGTGGPNHRPYVGGFAAAAYEAARAHHTQETKKQEQKEQEKTPASGSKQQQKP